MDHIAFCGQFDISLCGHDESGDSEIQAIFRRL